MDILKEVAAPPCEPIQCVEMHTTGEPTRIVVKGYPELRGSTLLAQRADAKQNHDHIRKLLILEPRGHFNMYGAVLRPETECTKTGQADIGVLFMTNDGYSTMCGHATIALGRFLLDTHDLEVFPRRHDLPVDRKTNTAALRLHAPCGIIEVTVPVSDDGHRSDPSRPVSFISVPSFASGINVDVAVPSRYRWPELGDRHMINVDFAYGGAFYCIVPAIDLGFADGLRKPNFDGFNRATRLLKMAINANEDLRDHFRSPDHEDLGFLYSIMVTDATLGRPNEATKGAETGLCYFADQQVDRSPTGSAVVARVALAVAKGEMSMGESWTYHSFVSNAAGSANAFVGTARSEEIAVNGAYPRVKVTVEGKASYTGFHTFVCEPTDALGHGGFIFEKLMKDSSL